MTNQQEKTVRNNEDNDDNMSTNSVSVVTSSESVEDPVVTSTTVETPKKTSSANSNETVTKLATNDVLMGRGAAVIGNEGNRRFRKLIQKYKNEYDATRIRQEKDRIARKIVETITSRGGRFLKKIETPAQMEFYRVPAGKSAWAIVKEAVVLQKVKQAFRDDRRSLEEGGSNHSQGAAASTVGSPTLIKPAALGGGLPQRSTMAAFGGFDSLLGGSPLAGNPALVNPALLMRPQPAPPVGTAYMPYQQQQPQSSSLQQLLKSQLDNQLIAQLLAARQLDPLTALRNQTMMEENQRVMLLRQIALDRQNSSVSLLPETLAVLNREAAIRERVAAQAELFGNLTRTTTTTPHTATGGGTPSSLR